MKLFSQEVLRVILLDTRYRHSSTVEITKGSINESLAYPCAAEFRKAGIHPVVHKLKAWDKARPRLNQAVSLDAATVTREIVIPGETLEEAGPLVQVMSIIEFALADKGG